MEDLKAESYTVTTSCIISLQRNFPIVGSCCPQLVRETFVGTFSGVENVTFEVSRSIFQLCNDSFAWHQSFVNQNPSCPCLVNRQSNQTVLDFETNQDPWISACLRRRTSG